MRLLSFLTDIEQTLIAEAGMLGSGTWETTRMVNYHQGLARMIVTEKSGTDAPQVRGTIFLQSFTLADGSQCLKATLNWANSSESPVMSVYSKPRLNWRAEAGMIASAWISGPATTEATHALVGADDEHELTPMAVSA